MIVFAASLTLVKCPPPPQVNPIYSPTCWGLTPKLRPAVFAACRTIINRIPTSSIGRGHDPDIPLKFSPDPSQHPDIELPAAWGSGDNECNIALLFDAGTSDKYDRTTLRDVQLAALVIARECVIKSPHLGGLVELGWEKHMAVNVLSLAPSDLPVRDGNWTLERGEREHVKEKSSI